MPRKKRNVPASGPVWRMSAEEATLAKMPRYNAHACGTGAHGDAKYNRAKQKRAFMRDLEGGRTHDRGSFPFFGTPFPPGRIAPFAPLADLTRPRARRS